MYRAIAEIDLAALRHNVTVVRTLASGCQILAMVKGNAYGHGLVSVSQGLSDVDYLGVACLEAAIALRQAGILKPIVLMTGFTNLEELNLLLQYQLQSVVYDSFQVELIERLSSEAHLGVWLEINTGMNRLGFRPEAGMEAWRRLASLSQIDSLRWMTHFACADETDHPHTLGQLEKFQSLTKERGELKSAANSAAIFQYPEAHFDIVRPGLMLYGVSPLKNGNAAREGLKPVMTLKAKVVALNTLSPGESVGYGGSFKANSSVKIALVSIGYGDGYPQHAPAGTPVLLRGTLAPVVGRVSMDSLTIDVSHIPDVKLFDEVILWGPQLLIEEVALKMNLSPYGLLTGVTPRVKRELIHGEAS